MEHGKLRGRGRIIASFVIGVLAIVSGVVLGGGEASAHNPVLSGRVTCDGIVHFTATSWTTGESGTNPDVEIFYLKENTGVKVTVMHGSFSEANKYSFSGTFPWPAGAELIVMYAEAQGLWGDGVSTVGNWWTEWLRIGGCQETTTTEAATTTTEAATTTTQAATTTTQAATTTTELGSDGPTTSGLASEAPATSISSSLPSTGSDNGPFALLALGICLIGLSFVLMARRIQA